MVSKIRFVDYAVKKIKGTPYIPALNDGALRCFLVKLLQGDLQRAGEIFSEILNDYPSYSDAWYLLGVVMLETGNEDIAIGLLNQAVELLPDQARYQVDLGVAHLRMDNLIEAQACFDHAESLDGEAISNLNHSMLMEIGRIRPVHAKDERSSVRPLNFILDHETPFESEITTESLDIWLKSDIYQQEFEYFHNYPEKSRGINKSGVWQT